MNPDQLLIKGIDIFVYGAMIVTTIALVYIMIINLKEFIKNKLNKLKQRGK